MQYAEGKIGRVFYLRIDHGEDLHATLRTFIEQHDIQSGIIQMVGAVKNTSIVCGPKEDRLPPDPDFHEIAPAHEIIGTGFIRKGPDGPALHLHISAGRGDRVRIGCLRSKAEVFIVIEAVIIEFTGIALPVIHDSKTGIHLPEPENI